MLKFLPLALLGGCVTAHNPKPSDTKFDQSKRDWTSVYQKELEIAIDNQDDEARYFFLQEIIKIKFKVDHDMVLPPNPSIKIIN